MDKNKIKNFAAWARINLINQIKEKLEGLIFEENKIEEAASVWFNRLNAIHYLKINKIGVKNYLSVSEKCCWLKKLIPHFFGENFLYIENLMPCENFIYEEYFPRLENEIPIEEFYKPEIIGWLHQYFMTEKKNKVYNHLKSNIKVSREDIPAATQVFTPEWIVKYLVENSLGRVWLENKDNEEERNKIINQFSYYIKEQANYEKKKIRYKRLKEITIIDPCMGSGNILLYTFEVLYKIYEDYGYNKEEIPRKILQYNLFGLDIDERAMELTSFSLIMKAVQYNNKFLLTLEKEPLKTHFLYVQDSNLLIDKIYNRFPQCGENIFEFLENFKGAGNYGSLLKIKNINIDEAIKSIEKLELICKSDEDIALCRRIREFEGLYRIMTFKYMLCITNPPYLGIRGVNDALANYISYQYPASKHDLCTVYMEVAESFIQVGGIYALINQHSWMFLGSFQELRRILVDRLNFISMIHLGTKAFEENVGTIVQNTAFIVEKEKMPGYVTTIIDCREANSSREKEALVKTAASELKRNKTISEVYFKAFDSLMTINRQPIAYWISDRIIKAFKDYITLGSIAKARQGMASSDNKRFLRYWYEVDKKNICFYAKDASEAVESDKKWFPYRKGGPFRKWYGNNEFIINWQNGGKEVKEYAADIYKIYTRTIKNEKLYFKSCITYTFISEELGVRYSPPGFIFDVAGSSIFIEDEKKEKVILGFMCSKIAKIFLDVMNPTYNIQVGDLKNIPINEGIFKEDAMKEIIPLVEENIFITKNDWDERETSWDFEVNPLVKIVIDEKCSLKEAAKKWSATKKENFKKVKFNEERLNEVFINIYGLEEEVEKEIDEDYITLDNGNIKEAIKGLISFGVGCIMGRYELENFKTSFYVENNLCFITEEDCEVGDLASKFTLFLQQILGEKYLEENINYISEILSKEKNETDTMRVRRYFYKEFIKDHISSFNGTPLYWMFNSGNNGGIKVLSYSHRYKGTEIYDLKHKFIPMMLAIYNNNILNLGYLSKVNNEIFNITKSIETITDKMEELKLYSLSIDNALVKDIKVNLDDGIIANYNKFKDVNANDTVVNLLYNL